MKTIPGLFFSHFPTRFFFSLSPLVGWHNKCERIKKMLKVFLNHPRNTKMVIVGTIYYCCFANSWRLRAIQDRGVKLTLEWHKIEFYAWLAQVTNNKNKQCNNEKKVEFELELIWSIRCWRIMQDNQRNNIITIKSVGRKIKPWNQSILVVLLFLIYRNLS